MPVEFYPKLPIELLDKYIINEDGSPNYGEVDIYRQIFNSCSISERDWYVWHNLKLPFHSETVNPYRKTEAQIDFLILCEDGLLVLEVKGGAITLSDGKFYYGTKDCIPMKQNPYQQVEGYKFTIKDRILNTKQNLFIAMAVAFPHSRFFSSSKLVDMNITWSITTQESYKTDNIPFIERFFVDVLKYSKEKHRRHNRYFPKLSAKEMKDIIRILNPVYADSINYITKNTIEWLNIHNLEIIEGLSRNNMIMLCGGPGTGKTTMAKAYIDMQGRKKGLYLCWNNFLAIQMNYQLRERGLDKNCEVITLTKFLHKLDPSLEYENILKSTEDQYWELFSNIINKKLSEGQNPHYDYIVIDEAQDVLDRGAELIMNGFVGIPGKGLDTGSCLVLYDFDQSYFISGRRVVEMLELVQPYFCHFRLNDYKRSAQNPSIRTIAERILEIGNAEQQVDLEVLEGVFTKYFFELEDIKDYLINKVVSPIRGDKGFFKATECMVLIESSLYVQKNETKEPGMQFWLNTKGFEELSADNINDKSNILKYTTILKYKGLEQNNIYLVANRPSIKNFVELYIGITRAILNINLLILMDD